MSLNKPCSSPRNPHARNSEICDPMRRSVSGSPFTKPSIVANPRSFHPKTPVNSPSDFPRRNSFSSESVASLRDHENKENGKDPNWKPARLHSPAAAKGPKNFMSPTISAASKFAASPKRKVLTERIEPARTSVSSSNGKSPFRSVSFADFVEEINPKPEMDTMTMIENKTEVSHDVTVTDLGKETGAEDHLVSESFSDDPVVDCFVSQCSENDAEDKETIVVEKDCIAEKRGPLSGPILVPLDADPSMPPYDPKNNYLSPRPQFLHYKPNPRIGSYLNSGRDGKRLEANLFPEFYSDTEVSEDTEDTQKKSEDTSSSDVANDQEEEEKGEPQVSEVDSITAITRKKPIEAEVASKSRFFTRSKFVSLILVILVACSSIAVDNYPVIQPSAFDGDPISSKFYIPPEFSEFARENLDSLSQNFQQWLTHSLVYVQKLVSSFRKGNELGFLKYSNITELYKDQVLGGRFFLDHEAEKTEERSLQNLVEPTMDRKIENVPGGSLDDMEEISELRGDFELVEPSHIEADGSSEADLELNTDAAYEEQLHQDMESANHIEQISEEGSNIQIEEIQVDTQGDFFDLDLPDQKTTQVAVNVASNSETEVQMQSNEVLEADLLKNWVVEEDVDEPQHGENCLTSSARSEFAESPSSEPSFQDSLGFKGVNAPGNMFGYKLLGVSVVLLAAMAFLYAKKGKGPMQSAVNHQERGMLKKFDISPNLTTLESCPSEMSSSFLRSYNRRGLKNNEAHSHERKSRKSHRRESMATSDCSMSSPSYGSFTTYERLAVKSGEEEVITPVRRSSRIRKQVTSSCD